MSEKEKSKKVSQMNGGFFIRTRLMLAVDSRVVSLALPLRLFRLKDLWVPQVKLLSRQLIYRSQMELLIMQLIYRSCTYTIGQRYQMIIETMGLTSLPKGRLKIWKNK